MRMQSIDHWPLIKRHNCNHQGRALDASAATVYESAMHGWNEREVNDDGHARGHDTQEKVWYSRA